MVERRRVLTGRVLTKKLLEVPMARYRLLLGFAVLCVSLFAVSIETEAKVLSVKSGKREVKASSTSTTGKSRTLRRVLCQPCNCAAVNDLDGNFSGCFSRCLSAWVDSKTAVACAATCVAAGTGNVVAIALCAACVGTGEWIAGYCAMKCVWGSHAFSTDSGAISKRRTRPRSPRGTEHTKV